MTRVIFDISMSVDGFVTAANVRPEEPLGDGGQRLHEWAFGEDERNRELLAEAVNFVGAVIAGRRTYDLSIASWGADGQAGPARVPCSSSPTPSPRRGLRGRLHLRDRRDRERLRGGQGGCRG